MRVEEALDQLRAASEQLAADFPDIASDDELWLTSIESLTDAVDLAEQLAERAIFLVSMQAAALERARSLQARAKRFEAAEDKLKAIILALVDAAGGRKIVRPGVTLSPRNTPPKVVAVNPEATPEDYLVTVSTTKPDTKAIRDALELGIPVEGWMRTNGGRSIALLVR